MDCRPLPAVFRRLCRAAGLFRGRVRLGEGRKRRCGLSAGRFRDAAGAGHHGAGVPDLRVGEDPPARHGRGRRRGESAGERPAEKAAADNKPARSEKANKPAGDKPNREGGSRRRRSGRRGSGGGQTAPAAAEAAPKKQERPAGEAPAGEKKRSRHRPRRRSGGGGKPNGGAEA